MIIARTVVITDPFARANVVETLAGPGAPSGVTACRAHGDAIDIAFDDERTSSELIEALIAIASRLVPERGAPIEDLPAATALLARSLNEPALDTTRIIETYLT